MPVPDAETARLWEKMGEYGSPSTAIAPGMVSPIFPPLRQFKPPAGRRGLVAAKAVI
jgi:hypothetical protein